MKIVTKILLLVAITVFVVIGATSFLTLQQASSLTDHPETTLQYNILVTSILIGLAAIGILYFALRQVLLHRLKLLKEGMEIIGQGNMDFRLHRSEPDEIGDLESAFNEMIVELEDSAQKRKWLEADLREAQKLEAVGQLAGGIAHEINTPSQYIGDNLKFLMDSHDDLFALIEKCLALTEKARTHYDLADLITDVDDTRDMIDLEYLQKEIPAATEQSSSGIGQVSRIVLAMREISHPGTKEMTYADINKTLENTLIISRNEWKHIAEVTTSFDSTLPAVMCLTGELNQVFLNLIVNAAHSIADNNERKGLGEIKVSTETDEEHVVIRISDNGMGIPEEIHDRIFNPFFTTKEIGKGTGQGLSIARDIIMKKHNGVISFSTELGSGTTFTIRMPIRSASSNQSESDTNDKLENE